MTDIFYLNIGGQTYHTTRTTLLRIPYFQSFFERWDNGENSQSNPHFIDQDGPDFGHILKWCRDSNYKVPNNVSLCYWLLDESIKESPIEPIKSPIRKCLKCGIDYDNCKMGRACTNEHKCPPSSMSSSSPLMCIDCGNYAAFGYNVKCYHHFV